MCACVHVFTRVYVHIWMYVGQDHLILIIGEGQVIHMTAKGVEKKNIVDIANECPFFKDNSFDKNQRLALILITIYIFKYDFHIQYMISIFSI